MFPEEELDVVLKKLKAEKLPALTQFFLKFVDQEYLMTLFDYTMQSTMKSPYEK